MTVAGLIFSNIHDGLIPELTVMRTMASVPFGARYRLIDFALSNMVNSNITKIGVITHYNYQSLLDHIGTGKDWDLARRSGGIKILPPYITAYDNAQSGKLYNTRLEALIGANDFVSHSKEEFFVLSDCDVVCNINISDVIKKHIETEADITIVTKKTEGKRYMLSKDVTVIKTASDNSGRIIDVSGYTPTEEPSEISMNIMVMKRTYLLSIIRDAVAHGFTNFYRDIIAKKLGESNCYSYTYDGYYLIVNSLEGYFKCSMKLLTSEARTGLFGIKNRPVYTKVRNSVPTKYISGATIKNSLIADGCTIEGVVENSIIFRGVKVGKGSVIKNSVIMQDTYIGSNVNLNYVITDKNVIIKDDRVLSGYDTLPFYINKGAMV